MFPQFASFCTEISVSVLEKKVDYAYPGVGDFGDKKTTEIDGKKKKKRKKKREREKGE